MCVLCLCGFFSIHFLSFQTFAFHSFCFCFCFCFWGYAKLLCCCFYFVFSIWLSVCVCVFCVCVGVCSIANCLKFANLPCSCLIVFHFHVHFFFRHSLETNFFFTCRKYFLYKCGCGLYVCVRYTNV